jgi:TonB family protein
MSDSLVPAGSSTLADARSVGGAHEYALSSDLAKLSLPAEYVDSYRNLAWTNSICFLFLVIGIIGLKTPRVVQRPLIQVTESAPVIFTPPEDQPKPEPEVQPDEPTPQDAPVETPQVVTVAAPADAPVAFAVPVQGAVAVAKEARFASPPPPVAHVPAGPTKFDPNANDGGNYPLPGYPREAQLHQYQGVAVVEFRVDEAGHLVSVKVQKSSGYSILDDVAVAMIKNRWRFPPGPARWYTRDFVFKLE